MTFKDTIASMNQTLGAAEFLTHLIGDPALDANANKLILASYARYVSGAASLRVPTNPATYSSIGEII